MAVLSAPNVTGFKKPGKTAKVSPKITPHWGKNANLASKGLFHHNIQ
jgi:hypothetical protein